MSAQESSTTATAQPSSAVSAGTQTTQPPTSNVSSSTLPASSGPAPAPQASSTSTAAPSTSSSLPSMQTTAAPADSSNNGGSSPEQFPCQWHGCSDQLPTAELLYEHVCERHVGRKSTNNLCLTCQWANCRTHTVKRDHITSHIRVHVPLKPHKCEFCGKAFKRPQDLKKHVKTHADDSVLIRPTEQSMGGRGPSNMGNYSLGNGRPASFFDNPLSGVVNHAYGQPASHNQYYHPQPQAQHHAGTAAPYGNVYYSLGQADGGPIQDRKRGYEVLNEFFGDLKRRQFDTRSYDAASQRLMNLHQPLVHSGVLAEYQPMPAMVGVGGAGGGPGVPFQAYQLPTLSNIRNKADLVSIDHYLEQVSNTIYEGAEHMAAAGTGQPGAHYIQHDAGYRHGHSPQSSHMHQTAPRQHHMSISSHASQSPTGTPALTPPSSAQSYTSGHSPISHASHHQLSPLPGTSAGLYPTLPAAAAPSDEMSHGYATSGASASTLGGIYDNGDRRRYQGGMLQSARPGSDDGDVDMGEGSVTPPVKRTGSSSPKGKFANAMIDPMLAGSPGRLSSAGGSTPRAEGEGSEGHSAWLDQVRLLEFLRRCVKETMTAFNSAEDGAAESGEGSSAAPYIAALRAAAGGSHDEDEEMEDQEHEDDAKMMVDVKMDAAARSEEESLYPVLRAVEED